MAKAPLGGAPPPAEAVGPTLADVIAERLGGLLRHSTRAA
jgi:hypothetical protein